MATKAAAGASQPTRHNDKKRKLSANNNTPASTSTPGNNSPTNTSSSESKRPKHTKSSAMPPPRPSIPHTLTTATSLLPDDHDGSKALKALEDVEKYDVQIHSVISSSKMQKKVGSVLRHLQSTDQSRIRVTVLRARGADAGKLVSIAEIAKREVEKVDGGKGIWYQYILVGEELQERKRGNESVLVEETVLDQDVDENGEGDEKAEGEDDEDDFEVMKTRFERAIEGKPLVRGVPIMSLFLSRVNVGELRRRCGEQTNSLP